MKKKDELTYWEKRAILAEEKVKLSADKTSNMIIRAYLRTQNYFREEIRKLFRRAERLTGASEDVMKTVLSQKVPDEELMEFSRLAKSENKEVAKVARERLQQEAIKSRITRLDVLRAKAYIATKQLADVEKLKTEDLLTRTAKRAYVESMEELEGVQPTIRLWTGEEYTPKNIPNKEVKNILETHWKGSNFSERIWKDTDRLAERLEELFTEKNLTAMSEREMAQRLAHEFEVGAMIAKRLVQTESNYVYNQGKLKGWKERNLDGHYKFVAIMDERTSKRCREHSEKIYKISEAKVNENFPPLHPWCRSTVVLWMKPYISVKNEWLENRVDGAEVIESKERTIDGVKYVVDGHNVTFSHDEHEKEVAETLVNAFGGKIELLPEIKQPERTKNPDFLLNGEYFELKTLKPKNKIGSFNNFKQEVRRANKQAHNIVLDLQNYKLGNDEIEGYVERIFKSNDFSELKTIVLMNNTIINDVYKRV